MLIVCMLLLRYLEVQPQNRYYFESIDIHASTIGLKGRVLLWTKGKICICSCFSTSHEQNEPHCPCISNQISMEWTQTNYKLTRDVDEVNATKTKRTDPGANHVQTSSAQPCLLS